MTLKYFKNLAYEEIGEDNEEIILFLHTKLLDKWIWKKQKEGFNQYFNDYHCIFLDLPNHGDSKSLEDDGNNSDEGFSIKTSSKDEFSIKTSSEDGFSIKTSSKQISEFIIHLTNLENKANKINIVGLGLGGQIAIEILNQIPNSIDNLILSGIEISDFKENEENSILNRLAKTQSEYLNEKPDTFIVKAYLRYFGISKDYFKDMKSILDISIKDEKKIAYESLNYTIPDDLINDDELLKKENILIVFGNKEDLNCTRSAIELKELFKNARLVEINKGNHLWNIIDSETFNKIISDFIKSNSIVENSKVKLIE